MSPITTNDALVIEVETATPGSFVAVNDLTGFESTKSRGLSSTRVFMKALPLRRAGAPEFSIELEGILNTDDPGQARIRAQEIAGLPVNIRVQPQGPIDPDGAGAAPVGPSGYTVVCVVTNVRHSGEAGDDYQGWGCTLVPTADKVLVSIGPVV